MAVRLNYLNKKAEHDLELRKEQKKKILKNTRRVAESFFRRPVSDIW